MKPIYSGKVREIYDISDDRLVIVTTDRISAFDSILPKPVSGKGVILNQLSNFWFDRTRSIVPNHILDDDTAHMPSFFQKEEFKKRTVMVQKLNMLPFEFIVRGYLFGSMWNAYQNSETFCGIKLNASYEEAQKLEFPILTPALKQENGHDTYLSKKDLASHIGSRTADRIEELCLRLYDTAGSYARKRGLILADAKFEFGLDNRGGLVLADELFTPDSSRYWDAGSYKAGTVPPSFDKQFLRGWLLEHRTEHGYPFDQVPDSVLSQTKTLYEECFRRLTGQNACDPADC